MVERVPKSATQDDALVAAGQLGKLFLVVIWVVCTNGQDAERDHGTKFGTGHAPRHWVSRDVTGEEHK